MAERFRKMPGMDPIMDSALSFAASAEDPASGGRHKVWGSKPLWVLPQTSTIASHLPKALGTAVAIEHARRIGHALPIPGDSIAICSFGDASSNHATAQTAFNAASWTAYQKLPAPVLYVCEDNGIGISVKTPDRLGRAKASASRPDLDYFFADGLDLANGYGQVQVRSSTAGAPVARPSCICAPPGSWATPVPTSKSNGAASRNCARWRPAIRCCAAQIALESGADVEGRDPRAVRRHAQEVFRRCRRCRPAVRARDAGRRDAPAGALHAGQGAGGSGARADYADKRINAFGSEEKLPEKQVPRHLAIQINQALHDLFCKYPETLLFGEDVAQKGGVYTVTKGLHKAFGNKRVFNTLLDETIILGWPRATPTWACCRSRKSSTWPISTTRCDQIRGEAASLQFFSNDQFRNPMVVRIAGLGYQRGFGGHFHNDNSITALRDIPGLVVGCPSRGDDAATMLRTLMALAKVDGRVCVFLEPIALYMTKDLVRSRRWPVADRVPGAGPGDGARRGRVYNAGRQVTICVIFSYRQRDADEPARCAADRGEARLEGARGRPALAGAAQHKASSSAGAPVQAHPGRRRGPLQRRRRRGRDHCAIDRGGTRRQPRCRGCRRRHLHAAGGCCVPGDPEGRGHRGRG
jgi:2-oxoisovalerate dehydrogenase E1 component